MAAGFHHFAITRKICLEFGVSESQSNLLAHFASVYADGMKGKISEINCQFGSGYYQDLTSEFRKYLFKSNEIEYDIEHLTQSIDDKYQLWHCTRHKDSGRTSQERMNETAEFAWGKLFESSVGGKPGSFKSSSGYIRDFGQAIHAFQDIVIHRGARYNGDIIDEHSDTLDIFPGSTLTSKMQGMTRNALRVLKLLTDEDIDGLIGKRIRPRGLPRRPRSEKI